MEFELRPVTMANRGELDDIDPGLAARGWVHVPWYWHQASLDRADLVFRLIYVADSAAAVGMVAYGRAYADRELTKPVRGRYELAHLVIDERSQRKGVGRAVARRVLAELAGHADCRELLIAHHPDNHVSRTLFTALGLAPSTERNYDGDPVLIGVPGELAITAWSALHPDDGAGAGRPGPGDTQSAGRKSRDLTEQGPPRSGRLIVLCGLPGSGKTALAVELEARGAVRFTPDEWVLQRGLDGASDDLRHSIDLLALSVGEHAAEAGATVVLDLGFWQKEHRDATRTKARECGVAVELRYLDLPIGELLRRVRERNAHVRAPWQRIEEDYLRTWATRLEAPTPEELALYDAHW